MKLTELTDWLNATVNLEAFRDDVSNNGLQVARRGEDVSRVAVAVDASVRAVDAAAAAGAELLIVHHGISWGGGIRRLAGGVYEVVRRAIGADLAVWACHLPLDAHAELGNNAQLAARLGLTQVEPAFAWHGHVIGVVGTVAGESAAAFPETLARLLPKARLAPALAERLCALRSFRVGVCSGGAGEFAEEAKNLGCALYVTGEADWGDVIAAENCNMPLVCGGHYETEVFGVRALADAIERRWKIATTAVGA